jgi:hypothetical protein
VGVGVGVDVGGGVGVGVGVGVGFGFGLGLGGFGGFVLPLGVCSVSDVGEGAASANIDTVEADRSSPELVCSRTALNRRGRAESAPLAER